MSVAVFTSRAARREADTTEERCEGEREQRFRLSYVTIYVTLDHKTSHKCQFFEIEL